MNVQEYLIQMKNIQSKILEFVENEDFNKDSISSFIISQLNSDNIFEIKEILHLISKIENNHHRSQLFFDKIQFIIILLKEKIQKCLSNFEIFKIFKTNKKILLFLFEEKIIVPDKKICNFIRNDLSELQNFFSYFFSEFKKFFVFILKCF